MKIKYIIINLFAIFFMSFSIFEERISLKMIQKRLFKDKYLNVEANIYYNFENGKMITNYIYPENYIFISNKYGETKIYYPDKNQVEIKVDEMLSSENNLLFYFTSNQTYDMGLKSLKFKINETHFEEDLMITLWSPPTELLEKINKIKIVHKDYLPIYTAYFNNKNQITKKIFYSKYENFTKFSIPCLITEFNFLENGDSTVSKIIYSDIKIGRDANGNLFDFEIPSDAKILKKN